jgi:hypothetical protein
MASCCKACLESSTDLTSLYCVPHLVNPAAINTRSSAKFYSAGKDREVSPKLWMPRVFNAPDAVHSHSKASLLRHPQGMDELLGLCGRAASVSNSPESQRIVA